jgi:hypothetical protein
MKPKLAYLSILVIFILACSLPGFGAPTDSPGAIQTSAALTIQAVLITTPVTATIPPTASKEVAVTNTITATTGPTATITPTYSVPMLTLREQTNCRTGPGLSYDILFAYVKGVRREIIGYYPQENYWLVKAPESATGECWIWGEYADVTGSYWVVPSLTPPPTATLTPPIAPSITRWDFFCSTATGEMNITILWKDNTNNEIAFVVYRDEQAIVQLPPDSSSYSETINLQAGETIKYQIEVISPGGRALSSVVSVTC